MDENELSDAPDDYLKNYRSRVWMSFFTFMTERFTQLPDIPSDNLFDERFNTYQRDYYSLVSQREKLIIMNLSMEYKKRVLKSYL